MSTAQENLASRVRELEIKVTFLEDHVEAQDRAMVGHLRELGQLRRIVDRLAAASAEREDAGRLGEDERPPHY
ncbi:MAG: SlyX family protein [Puniceicoccales bacterium]|jgi:uncharacterized coiled-coil protein SlyX|nr:SlyX family protein [Puniceicoccales bacterium]